MDEIALAFVWHQHQPYYPNDVSGENPMPWVRLHGTKDYWGMAMHLKEVPEVHATINLVPSLLKQLMAYAEEGHHDTHLRVSRLPADGFSEDDLYYLLDNFFMVHPDQMIRPYRRYFELYKKRGMGVDTAERAKKRFNRRDIVDLQVWANLVWIHPLAFHRDKDLAELRSKGRHYTEKEKQWLLDKQLELLGEIIPLHRELQRRGQVELTTTPFYHPILPLLWDKRLARQAMPEVALPEHLESYRKDIRDHVRRAVEMHRKLFGLKPRGMWPSEGSVCQGMIPAIAEAGIHWIATDEEILAGSTDGHVSRDNQGHLRHPELLYRPWSVEEQGHGLQIIFRDHAMSDQIGFHYQRQEAKQAVDDFVGRVEAIGRATAGKMHGRPTLVSIILDGENCWEYYPGGGVEFLRTMYHRLTKHPKIKPVRVCDYLEEHPATDRIGRLFPGSWIQHNFAIWIGHPECNRAWDLLHETRHFFNKHLRAKTKSAEQIAAAREELYIAEGSDWFWWFGDDHTSAQDNLFDRLFRTHLQNVYRQLGEQPPPELAKPISRVHKHLRLFSDPTSLLNVKVDGRRTYFEWLNAGHYAEQGGRGTMAMADRRLVSDLYFGFDEDCLLLRLDARDGVWREQLAEVDMLRVVFVQPEEFELLVSHPTWREPIFQLYHRDVPVAESRVRVAADLLFELSIPLRSLAVASEDPIGFYVELLREEKCVQRMPHEGAIETGVPSPDFELIMWQA